MSDEPWSEPQEYTGIPRLDEFDPVEVYVSRDRVAAREPVATASHNGHRHLDQPDRDDDVGVGERESDDDLPF